MLGVGYMAGGGLHLTTLDHHAMHELTLVVQIIIHLPLDGGVTQGRFHLETEGIGSGLTQGRLMCQGGAGAEAEAEAEARASVGAAVEAKITLLN